MMPRLRACSSSARPKQSGDRQPIHYTSNCQINSRSRLTQSGARRRVVVGGGTPFLPPVTEDLPLDLIETTTFGSRVIYRALRACPR